MQAAVSAATDASAERHSHAARTTAGAYNGETLDSKDKYIKMK
jgi:hypothetical protein